MTTVSSQAITVTPLASVTVNGTPATLGSGNTFSASVPLPPGQNQVAIVATDTQGNIRNNLYSIAGTPGPTANLSYDANGNILRDERGNKYSWDALNRLVSVTYPSGLSGTYVYDGLSRRVSITEPSAAGSKNYLWAGNQIVEQRDSSNSVQRRFYSQGEQIAGTAYYYTRDHLSSVRELVSGSGTLVSRLSYDMYGQTTVVSGSTFPTFHYDGYYADSTSGLYLTKYRAYRPNIGRWLSRDPAGRKGGDNPYEYVNENPMLYIDKNGLTPLPAPDTFLVKLTPGYGSTDVFIQYQSSCCKNVRFMQWRSTGNQEGPWVADTVSG